MKNIYKFSINVMLSMINTRSNNFHKLNPLSFNPKDRKNMNTVAVYTYVSYWQPFHLHATIYTFITNLLINANTGIFCSFQDSNILRNIYINFLTKFSSVCFI